VATRLRTAPSLAELRRRLAGVPGVRTASFTPATGPGRPDEARIVPAELIEPGPVSARAVGSPLPWPGTVAFLDGMQRYEVAGYIGAAPLVLAEVSAAVRERIGGDSRTVVLERRSLVLARPEALALAASALEGALPVELVSEEPVHPLRDLELARTAVDSARGELERRVGTAYRRRSEHWLVVDGSLAESPAWASDPRTVGVARSHASLPFGGEDLVCYLQLPQGNRSNLFRPASRLRAPVYAWGLRLWDWTGKDLLYGLVRVEAAPNPETLALADTLSRWLLAERAPISADLRWDRLLYGIHTVGQFLKATSEH
jgi:hypothetical protein